MTDYSALPEQRITVLARLNTALYRTRQDIGALTRMVRETEDADERAAFSATLRNLVDREQGLLDDIAREETN